MPTNRFIAKALDAIPLEERTTERILHEICHVLAVHPASIGEIIPDKRLENRILTRKEAAKKANQASVKRSKTDTEKRYEVLVPFIKGLVDKDPDISLAEIRKELDAAGYKPLRSKVWNRASILYIMRHGGLARDDDG
jgi:hypothetical protein